MLKKVNGTQGRNTKTKTHVFGIVQRNGNVKARIVENVKTETLEREIVDNIK